MPDAINLDELDELDLSKPENVQRYRTALRTLHARVLRSDEERATWETERAAMAAGLTDPEGIAFARVAYDRVPPEQRPEGGIGAWLKSDSIPRGVRAYLPAQGQQATTTTQPATQANQRWNTQSSIPGLRTKAHDPDKGTNNASGPSTAAPYSGDAVSRMSVADYARNRDAIWNNLGQPAPPLPAFVKPPA